MNWIWEMAQMFAFKLKPEDSRIEILVFCTLASVVDALVTIGIYKMLSRFFWQIRQSFIFLPPTSEREK